MQITLEIPDKLGESLNQQWGNISRRLLEILVVQSYQNGTINITEVRHLLDLPSRLATDGFLKLQGVYIDYTESEIDQDINNIAEVSLSYDRCL